MRLCAYVVFLFFVYVSGIYSGVQEKLQKPVPTCFSASFNAVQILPDLFKKRNAKQIDALIGEWRKYCDPARFEPLLRTMLLNDLLVGREPVLFESEVDTFLRFQRFHARLAAGEQIDPVFIAYYSFTIKYAKENAVVSDQKVHPLYYYYAGDSQHFQAEVSRDTLSPIGKAFDSYRTSVKSLSVLPLGVYGGAWQPVGANSVLGMHPLLGVFIGWGNYRWEIAANIYFKFADLATPITTQHNGQTISTTHFLGGYLGLDTTYNFFVAKRYDIGFTLGVAFDGFDVVKSSSSGANDGKSINSLNINVGPTLRYYFSAERSGYFLFGGRVNIVNYDNSPATNLSGIALSFYGGFGMALNVPRAAKLRELGGL